MRHQVFKGKLGLPTYHRKALLQNMLSSLLKYEHIETTVARAKQLKRFAEPFIELAKRGDLAAKRLVRESVHEKEAFRKLFEVYGPRFKDRQGGYVRMYLLANRHGDGAAMSLIEFLPPKDKENEPRIIYTKRATTDEEKAKEAQSKKSQKASKKEDKHLKKKEAKAREESQHAKQSKDVTHSHQSQGRKTEMGTGRSRSSKKGLT